MLLWKIKLKNNDMNEKILEIIQNNYNLFKGTNEAEIHASFEIEAFFKEFLSEFGSKLRQQSFNEGFEEARKKYEYDFSKNCKCDTSIGETWCCNQCGLPVSK